MIENVYLHAIYDLLRKVFLVIFKNKMPSNNLKIVNNIFFFLV